jgi:hypothetical protein
MKNQEKDEECQMQMQFMDSANDSLTSVRT